jgi:uncharacterized LabA/DUF88 family protein
MAERTPNIALLIDADNASPDGIEGVLNVLAELGPVNVRRAYGNWKKPALKGWEALVHRYAIVPQQQFDLTKGKNATDMRMTIDAMDLLYSERITGFGLMSSDSDFGPIAMRLKQDGMPVYGFGTERAPESFRQSCTRFIITEQVAREAVADPARPAPKPVDEELIGLLVDAYGASKQDSRGFVSLSEIGNRVGNRSSFDARNYGAPRLSDLVERIPAFAVERRDNGVFVKRVK